MLHSHAAPRRFWASLGFTLACLLFIAALPAPPPRADGARAPVPSIPPGGAYRQSNIASNLPGLALVETPLLKNAWGLSVAPGRPFCVAANGTGVSLRYTGLSSGAPVLPAGAITIPGGGLSACAANGTGYFTFPPPPGSTNPRVMEEMFVTLDGRLLSYHPAVPSAPSTTATTITSFGPGTLLTGVTVDAAHGRIFLADFGNRRVIKLDQSFTPGSVGVDPTLSAEYSPYNVQVLGGRLYVAYAKRDPGKTEPDASFPGNGYVSVFDLDGNFVSRLVSRGPLLAPWGLALAPPDFGVFGGALLVGNYGGSVSNINAFDPVTGEFKGTLKNEAGEEIWIAGLRGLAFGAGGVSGDPKTLYFTSSGRPSQYGLFGSLTPTAETTTSLVGFRPEPFATREDAGHFDVTVTREGDVSNAATVNYATVEEPGARASQKSDYEIAVGKLTFDPGETEKTFRVHVNGDSYAEGAEEVSLVLSNPTGAGVGLGRSRAFLRIDDAPPTVGNLVDDPWYFVFQHYHDFLNRDPDQPGQAFWANQIAACPDVPCRDARRANVSAAFFLSIEFQETGMLNFLAHRAAFGRRPFYGEFMGGTQALQRGVVFGAAGAAERIEANRRAFFQDFVGGLPFASRYETTMTAAQFVDALYANAGVTPSAEERAAAVAEFQGADTADSNARGRVLRRVAENKTFARQEFNRAFVLMQYFGYLRREPDEAGFEFWLSKLNEHNGNYIEAEMVRAFIESAEYRRRFGPT